MHNHRVTDASASRVDPTGTAGTRAKFQAEMTRRLDGIKRLIREALVDMDVLGLTPVQAAGNTIRTLQFMATFLPHKRQVRDQVPSSRAFAFNRSSDQIAAFMEWLRIEMDAGILGIRTGTQMRRAASASWANLYIDSAYRKGIRDAAKRMQKAGARISEGWLSGSFNRPIHADRVGLIYTRVYSELEGITNAMGQQISRVLAQGMAEGKNPNVMARDIVATIDKIDRTRARVLARTEVINAHAEASLNTYAEAGLDGVEVEAEWSTAGDDRVCPECEELEGEVMSIEEARGKIPVHPQCRCAWKPVVANGSGIELS